MAADTTERIGTTDRIDTTTLLDEQQQTQPTIRHESRSTPGCLTPLWDKLFRSGRASGQAGGLNEAHGGGEPVIRHGDDDADVQAGAPQGGTTTTRSERFSVAGWLHKRRDPHGYLESKLDDSIAAKDYDAAMAICDEMKALKPRSNNHYRGAVFEQVMRDDKFDFALTWMKRIDLPHMHEEFLRRVGARLERTDEDLQSFVDAVCHYYLVELPALPLQHPSGTDARRRADWYPLEVYVNLSGLLPPSAPPPPQFFNILATFGEAVSSVIVPHARQIFDNLPLNLLWDILDTMPQRMLALDTSIDAIQEFQPVQSLFSGLNKLRLNLGMRLDDELAEGEPTPELSPEAEERARLIKAGSQMNWHVDLTRPGHRIHMGAKLGHWAVEGGATYKQAVWRIAEQTGKVDDSYISKAISNRWLYMTFLDLRGLRLQSLPPGIETLRYMRSFDLRDNALQRIPMELTGMMHIVESSNAQIEIDLRGNPLSKMTHEELDQLEQPSGNHRNRFPWFILPEVVYLEDGTAYYARTTQPKPGGIFATDAT